MQDFWNAILKNVSVLRVPASCVRISHGIALSVIVDCNPAPELAADGFRYIHTNECA
jgi:hypothetical protein